MASYTCIKLQKSTKQSAIQQYGWRQKLNNLFEPNETNSIDNSHNEYYYWQSTLNVFKEYNQSYRCWFCWIWIWIAFTQDSESMLANFLLNNSY